MEDIVSSGNKGNSPHTPAVLNPAIEHHERLKVRYPVVQRPSRLDDIRDTCDICNQTLFFGHLTCRLCGTDLCPSCMEEGRQMSSACARGYDHELVLMHAFEDADYQAVRRLLQDINDGEPPPLGRQDTPQSVGRFDVATDPRSLTYASFLRFFDAGIPVVVSGLNPGEDSLTPAAFIRRHGKLEVDLVDTATDQALPGKFALDDYLTSFSQNLLSSRKLKLKDFPSSQHFRSADGDQLDAYVNLLPAPAITTESGRLNTLANMPHGSVPPDAGPKGYFAHGYDDPEQGTTTRLHQDVGDAVNVQTWSAPDAYALWYIFNPDQRDELRRLLVELGIAKRRGWDGDGDPIHCQQVCLKPEDIETLGRHGIQVHVIEQRVGDAVFIPAGAPHQVTNVGGSMIKIATDFVFPSHVPIVLQVSLELRQHRLDLASAHDEPVTGDEVIPIVAAAYWTALRLSKFSSSFQPAPDSEPMTSNLAATPMNMPLLVGKCSACVLARHSVSLQQTDPVIPASSPTAVQPPAPARTPSPVETQPPPNDTATTAMAPLTGKSNTRKRKKARHAKQRAETDPTFRMHPCPAHGCTSSYHADGLLNHLINRDKHSERWTSQEKSELKQLRARLTTGEAEGNVLTALKALVG
ncbi:hypothetical protein PENSPDRAFT_693583 [Peniophora sp. CONT]|nr:hypothetical protein PENSPDRAFT_693583 [Peniophora sp. CONT]